MPQTSQAPSIRELAVAIPTAGVTLAGDLAVPSHAIGVVIFAHGSGSSRLSSRNRGVAATLNRAHLATLLLDLLTPAEAGVDAVTTEYRFNIPLLADRLAGATTWARRRDDLAGLPVGYFGASTGAAAALIAAAMQPEDVSAVVSRGGRPDLAAERLPQVHAPTLLIVGGNDREVLALNETALQRMQASRQLVIVPGATHLFEETGALEEVADLATTWFTRHFAEQP